MRLKSLFVAIMLLLSTASAFAAGPTLSLGNVNGVPGQTVTIPVTLTNNGASIASCEVQLDYDPAVLTPTGVTLGSAAAAASKTVNPIQVNSARYVVGIYALNTTAIGDGVVANVTFAVSSTATGSPVILNVPSASDPDGNDLAITGTGSTITLPDATPPSLTGLTIPSSSSSRTIEILDGTATDNVAVTGYLLNESSTQPSPTAAGWSSTPPPTYTFSSDGVKTLYGWVKDAAGNVSANVPGSSATVTIDTTAPSVLTFTLPATANSFDVTFTALTATDNIGVTGYLLTTTATAPAANASGWQSAKPTGYTFSAVGSQTIYAWVKDAANHVSLGVPATVNISIPDTTPPVVQAFTVSLIDLAARITNLFATDNSGVIAYYMVTESATAPAAADAGWSAGVPANYFFTTYGSKTLYGYAKDGSGNVSTGFALPVNVLDTVAPTVDTFTIPATGTTLTVPVSVLTATDNAGGGVTGYLITETATKPAAGATGWSATAPTSFAASAQGAVTLFAWAKDAAGNVSAAKSATITITLPDAIAPVVTAFTATADSATLTATGIAITANDNVNVTGYLVNESATAPAANATGWSATVPTSFTVSGYGTKTLFAWAKDAVGNVSLAKSLSLTFTDNVAPVVTVFTAGAGTGLSVKISVTATDLGGVTGYQITETNVAPAAGAAGWLTAAPTTYTASGQGSLTLYAWAKDAAGNVSLAKSAVVDTAAPSVTGFTLPQYTTTLAVPVTFTATDNVGVTGYLVNESATAPAADASGWTAPAAATVATTHTVAADGSVTIHVWAKDAAGNVSAAATATTVVDTTKPSLANVSWLPNNAFTSRSALNIAGSVSDALSGVASVTVSLNDATPVDATLTLVDPQDPTTFSINIPVTGLTTGANKIVLVATDAAGNAATDTRTINLDTLAPSISGVTPADNSNTNQRFVTVAGTVDEGTVKVTLNPNAQNPAQGGQPVAATMNGKAFTLSVGPLVPGFNTVQIDATDLAGNVGTDKITLLYVDSAPTLAITDPSTTITTRLADYLVKGTVNYTNSAYSNVGFTVKLAVNGAEVTPAPEVLAVEGGSFEFKKNITFADEKTYVVSATVTDATGNSSTVTQNIVYQKYTLQDVMKALRIAIGADAKTPADTAALDMAPYVDGKPSHDGTIDISDVVVLLNYAVGNYK